MLRCEQDLRFGAAGRARGRARNRGRDVGAVATEYAGMIVVAAVVVALIAVAIGPGAPVVARAVQAALCAITGGSGCAAPGTSAGAVPSSGDAPTLARPGSATYLSDQETDPPKGVLGQIGSAFGNAWSAFTDDVGGVVDLVEDPTVLWDAATYIWSNPLDAGKQLIWDDDSQTLWDGGDYGGAIGRTVWNVGSWFIPYYDLGKLGSKLGKLGDLGRIAEKAGELGKFAERASSAASRARVAADAGDLAGARKAAAEARQEADRAAEKARTDGCPLPVALPAPRQAPGGASAGVSVGVPASAAPGVSLAFAPLAAGCAEGESEAAAEAEKSADLADAAVRRAVLTVPKDTAYFWSGTSNGVGGADRAAEVAAARGGKTLETRLAETGTELPPWNPADPTVVKAWEDASRSYAENASGTVHAVVGTSTRPGSVWERIELPTLKANPKVDKIVKVDPETGLETVLWER